MDASFCPDAPRPTVCFRPDAVLEDKFKCPLWVEVERSARGEQETDCCFVSVPDNGH